MPLFYNKVQNVNPRDPKGVRKWYSILKSVGQVDEHEVAKLVSDETTLNPKEAEMAVYQPAGEGDGASVAGRPHGAARRIRLVLADHHRRGLPRQERGDTRQNQESQPAFSRVEVDLQNPQQSDLLTRGKPYLEENVKSESATRFWQMGILFSRDAHLIYRELLNSRK